MKRNTPLSPNLRSHLEQFIQTLKFECLNKFVIVAESFSTTCAESGVGITTKKDHIHLAIICRRISLRHLQKAVQTAHSLGIDREVEDVFPPSVTMLLYGLSIAVARVRLNERITRDRDEQFVPRACRLLEFTWVDDQSRQVLRDWLERLRT